MKKFYAMMAVAAICMPATAEVFEQNAVDLTNRIVAAEATKRPTDDNWLVAMYVEGGYKYTKVQTTDGVKSFVQHGNFVTYDESAKADTDQGTTNAKLTNIFKNKLCNGIKFSNIAMNNAIGEVTVPSKIYIDGTLTDDAAKGGDVIFRYGFGTDCRLGIKPTENAESPYFDVNLNNITGFEVGLELPDNNEVEVTFTSSLKDINDGLGNVGHVVYYQMGNAVAGSSSDTRKIKLTNVGELQGDKDFLSYVDEGKEDAWYHLPVKWLDIIIMGVKPGDTVGIYSLKSSENTGASVATIEAENENAPVEYFNMQGVRVSNPENGIYIKRQGTKVSKVVVK